MLFKLLFAIRLHDSMVFVHVVLTSVYLSLAFILLFLSE